MGAFRLSRKPAGDLFKRQQEISLFHLDLPNPRTQRNAPDPLGVACFGLLELLMQASNLFAEFGGWLLHGRRFLVAFSPMKQKLALKFIPPERCNVAPRQGASFWRMIPPFRRSGSRGAIIRR